MLVYPESFLPLRAKLVYHCMGRVMLVVISGYCRIDPNSKSIPVSHQNMTHAIQIRRLPFRFPIEFCSRISLRFVRDITPLLTMKII